MRYLWMVICVLSVAALALAAIDTFEGTTIDTEDSIEGNTANIDDVEGSEIKSATAIPTDYVGAWFFNDEVLTNTVPDDSGNGYAGTLGALYADRSHERPTYYAQLWDANFPTGCYWFGPKEVYYISGGNIQALNFSGSNSFSYGVAFKSLMTGRDLDVYGMLSGKGITTGNGYNMYSYEPISPTYKDGISYMYGSATHFQWFTGIGDTNWHHVLTVRSNQTQFLYLDGVLLGTDSQTITTFSNTQAYAVGDRGDLAGSSQFGGYIAYSYIWDSIVSSQQVYNFHTAATLPSNSAVVAWAMTNDAGRSICETTNQPGVWVGFGDSTASSFDTDHYVYDGVDDYASIYYPAYTYSSSEPESDLRIDASISTQATISVWLKSAGTDGRNFGSWLAFRYGDSTADRRWSFRAGGAYAVGSWQPYSIAAIWWNGATAYHSTTVSNTFTDAVDSNVWRHIVYTIDTTLGTNNVVIYKDAVAQSMYDNFFTNQLLATDRLTIGRTDDAASADVHWPGGIDDIEIFSRILSQAEVTALYNAGRN